MHDSYHPDPAAKWDLDGIDPRPCPRCGSDTTEPGLCCRCLGLERVEQLKGVAARTYSGTATVSDSRYLLALADLLSADDAALDSIGEYLGEHLEAVRRGAA